MKKSLHIVIMQITLKVAIVLSLVGNAIAKDSNAQAELNARVSIEARDEKFSKVLSSIERQSKVTFIYSSAIINSNRQISFSALNKKLADVLPELLAPLQLTYEITEDVILLKRDVREMELAVIKVRGRILDENGDALPGVSVKIAGSTGGTVSDIKGEYAINVPEGGSLTFSYVGYSTQTLAVTGERLDVTLRPDPRNQLSEVVVVGYGTQKRSDITGSVASVPKERLSKLPVNNVMQAIQGAVANVTVTQSSSIPGDAPGVQVRGRNSLSSSSEPYVVVDGIPLTKTDGSINDINPNDIQSVEILKDPSAVAIYGVNGSNGVILITTKRGTTGKPSIRYTTYAGVDNATDVLKLASGEEMLQRYAEYARITKTSLFNGGPVRNQFEAENYKNGVTTDWLDAVMQTGVNQNHNVSISGGSDNSKYYISGDYLTQKGVVLGYDYKRYSFRLNTDIKTTKYLTIGTSSFIVGHNRDGGRANLLNAMAMSPYATMYNPDGTLTQYPMYSEQLWPNPLLPTTLNPERRQFNMTLNGYGELSFGDIWKPLSGLKFKLNGGFTYVPTRTNEYEGKSVYNLTGLGRISNSESQTYTVENILSYNKDFGKHHFDFTGLYAAKDKYYQNAGASGENFPNDDLEWGSLNAGSTQKVSSYADRYRTISQMGRINYGFNSKYMFTFTVRRDGASVFGANNKYGSFPSAAVAWNVHNEPFLKQFSENINQLKLRFSYGLTGNEAISVYQTLSLMTPASLGMGGLVKTSIKTRTLMGNDNLHWEKTEGFNTGVDFGILGNRLSGSVDFYKTKTRDLLLLQRLPQIIGYTEVQTNLGKVSNVGVDLTLNSKNVSAKNFTWSSTIVFSSNKNKIVSLYGDGKDDLGNSWFIGQPIGVIWNYTKVGVWQADEIAAGANKNWDPSAEAGDLKLADLSGDGKITNDDRRILGQTSPKWTGGLTNTFTYKDFSLNIFINTVQGVTRNNSQLGVAGDEMGRRNSPAVIGYWTPENKSNEWRSLANNSNRYGYSYPSNASFTRLKDVTLSYNLPKSVIGKVGLGGLQVYASGRNLYTWTNWIGWDPEARDIARGSSNFEVNYPMVRSFVFGANVSF